MSDDNKKRFRKTMKERREDPRRTFSFKFTVDNEEHQTAREILEEWEEDYIRNHNNPSPLADIFTVLILEREGEKPNPMMTERRMNNLLLRAIKEMQEKLDHIASREPVIYQQMQDDRKEQGKQDISDDFFSAMLEDYNNTEGR